MGIRVCKFGGSSVADAGQMRKVRAIVDAEDERRFVVPSAPGKRSADDIKITDMLYRTNEAAAAGESIDPLFDQIAERYRKIVADLGLDFDLDPALVGEEIRDRQHRGAGSDPAEPAVVDLAHGLAVIERQQIDADPHHVLEVRSGPLKGLPDLLEDVVRLLCGIRADDSSVLSRCEGARHEDVRADPNRS